MITIHRSFYTKVFLTGLLVGLPGLTFLATSEANALEAGDQMLWSDQPVVIRNIASPDGKLRVLYRDWRADLEIPQGRPVTLTAADFKKKNLKKQL